MTKLRDELEKKSTGRILGLSLAAYGLYRLIKGKDKEEE
jgi:hypothetical protein